MKKYKAILAIFPEEKTILDTVKSLGVDDVWGEDETDALHAALNEIAAKLGYRLARPIIKTKEVK